MRRRLLLPGLLIILSTIGCQPESTPPPAPPRPVIAWQVPAPQSHVNRSFTGSTQASDSAAISFEVGGRILRLDAVRGQRYEAGTILAQLDVATYQDDLLSAEAEANRAGQELRRVQELFESDNSTRAQFDSAMAAQKSAMAKLSTARKRVDDGTLRMPFDGTIGEVLAEEQEVVAAGAAVFRLQGEGAMEFEVGVPSDVIGNIRMDQEAAVRIGSLPGHRLPAKVVKISREIAANTTYPVTLELNSTGLNSTAGLDVREGLDGEAEFRLPNPLGPTITVPTEAVIGAPDATRYVWVVDGEHGATSEVRRQSIRTGQLRQESRIEVLEGLKPGQRVVIRGANQLVEGTRVRVELRGGAS